jgi:hypothetical protein
VLKYVSLITINILMTGVELPPETSFVSNIPQAMYSVQYNILIMKQPLSQTFRESSITV